MKNATGTQSGCRNAMKQSERLTERKTNGRISAANIGPKLFHQKRTGFVADIDPALVLQILDIAERKRKPDDNITARRMIAGLVKKIPEWAVFGHAGRLLNHLAASGWFYLTAPAWRLKLHIYFPMLARGFNKLSPI